MLQVKRFGEYTKNFMQPGLMYDSIPYDYEGTEQLVLQKFDSWRKENTTATILSITGPLHQQTRTPGCTPAMYTDLTVLYEDNKNWNST
jgi:hypothetical protein